MMVDFYANAIQHSTLFNLVQICKFLLFRFNSIVFWVLSRFQNLDFRFGFKILKVQIWIGYVCWLNVLCPCFRDVVTHWVRSRWRHWYNLKKQTKWKETIVKKHCLLFKTEKDVKILMFFLLVFVFWFL